MVQRLQLLYGAIGFLAAVSLAGIVCLHFFPDWVVFPQENGSPSYGVWQACSRFPETQYTDKSCMRWWNYRWREEAALVHRPARAVASFFIFGMFFNLVLLLFVAFVALCASKVDFYPGVPVSLGAITAVMYITASLVMELIVKERLIRYSRNHTREIDDAPRENGYAAIGAWVAVACSIVNVFLGILCLVFKPTKEEIYKQNVQQFSMEA